ncbi:hypothetical protein, partial [Shewanella salipaludis]
MDEEKYLGYIKYDGKLVENGLMDARKQAQALLGYDAALRYFVGKQAPELRNLDFEIPVRIKKGSWEALIPETVVGWMQAGLGVVATAYFTKAAQKMAEKDFADFGIADIFKKAVEAVKWFARIGTHMGDVSIRKFEKTKFSDDNLLIGICNDKGDYLYIPKSIFDLYISSSPRLLEKIAENITEGRGLKIGTFHDGEPDEVTIDITNKAIFCKDEDEDADDVVLPELVHGDTVVLEGEVTREKRVFNILCQPVITLCGHPVVPRSGSTVVTGSGSSSVQDVSSAR